MLLRFAISQKIMGGVSVPRTAGGAPAPHQTPGKRQVKKRAARRHRTCRSDGDARTPPLTSRRKRGPDALGCAVKPTSGPRSHASVAAYRTRVLRPCGTLVSRRVARPRHPPSFARRLLGASVGLGRCRTPRNTTSSRRPTPVRPRLIRSRPALSVRTATSSSRTVRARLLRFPLPRQGSMGMPNVTLWPLTFSTERSLRILCPHRITVIFPMSTVLTTS